MSKLEDAIKRARERGEFVHLSVVSTDNGRSFEATFASASRAGGFSRAKSTDPAEAMAQAIMAAPMARKPIAPHHLLHSDDEALS